MSLTVADVLELKELGELELVAGSQGLSREIKGIAIFEDENAVPWIQENALVITNGTAISQNMGCVEDIIASLRSNGAAGMLVKFGRMLPRSSEQVASACDKHALPLIALPPQSSPTKLINVISREMFAREDKEPNRPCDVDLLRSIIIEGEDWRILKDRIASLGWSTRREMGVALLKCDDEGTPPQPPICKTCAETRGSNTCSPYTASLSRSLISAARKAPSPSWQARRAPSCARWRESAPVAHGAWAWGACAATCSCSR
ncbi:MAG TPA: PucR family transcriptional regulator ligand-binding domain-containing protein [Candidatus Rubneribacter avistercoris]|nr:PucR family transcriptional regulator ligand-binding domain-containing protein [Candidatus Rubneribacter avistercoris]